MLTIKMNCITGKTSEKYIKLPKKLEREYGELQYKRGITRVSLRGILDYY